MILPWHESSAQQLTRRISENVMHHAVLFSAPKGSGKRMFADTLAHYLLCQNRSASSPCGQCQACALYAAGSHPDLYQISSEKQVGVDQIRDAIGKLSSTAHMSGAKVLIIEDAHRMTESAANALLKTLEEPTPNTYIVLLCDTLESVLPTILSRCEKIRLPIPMLSDTQSWLATKGIQLPAHFIKMYGNAPLQIEQRESEQGHLTLNSFFEGLSSLKAKETLSHQLADSWQEHTNDVVDWMMELVADLSAKNGLNDANWQLHQSLIKAKATLARPGVNKTLILSGILDHMSHIAASDLEEYMRAGR